MKSINEYDYSRIILFSASVILTLSMMLFAFFVINRDISIRLEEVAKTMENRAADVDAALSGISKKIDNSINGHEKSFERSLLLLDFRAKSIGLPYWEGAHRNAIGDRNCKKIAHHTSGHGSMRNGGYQSSNDDRELCESWSHIFNRSDNFDISSYKRYIFDPRGRFLGGATISQDGIDGAEKNRMPEKSSSIDVLMQREILRKSSFVVGWWAVFESTPSDRDLILVYFKPILIENKLLGFFVVRMPYGVLGTGILDNDALNRYYITSDCGSELSRFNPLASMLGEGARIEFVKNCEKSEVRNRLIRISNYFFIFARSSDQGWTWIYRITIGEMLGNIRPDLQQLSFFLLTGVVIIWVFSIWFDVRILKPISVKARQSRDNAQFVKALIDLFPFGIFVRAIDSGEVIMMNNAFCALEGRCGDFMCALLDKIKVAGADDTLRSGGQVNFMHDIIEDHTSRHFDVAVLMTRYHGKDVLLFTTSDQTTRTRNEEALLAARREAEQAGHAKSSFLAMMSHEIRTPLHGALGNLELLERQYLTPDQRELVEIVRASFESLLFRINTALDITSIPDHGRESATVEFDLHVLIEECVQALLPTIRRPVVALDYRVDEALHAVKGDVISIRQILLNLLHNASKFTYEGSIVVSAKLVNPGVYAEEVEISVTDTGIGMTSVQSQRLFDSFRHNTNSTRGLYFLERVNGSGLGLALCGVLCHLIDANIRFDSEVGSGSRFVVRMPLVVGNRVKISGDFLIDVDVHVALVERDRWPNDFMAWLNGFGARVYQVSLSRLADLPDGSIGVVAMPSQYAARRRFAAAKYVGKRIIVIADDGPLRPVRRGGIWYVTAYSKSACIEALKFAVEGALNGNSRRCTNVATDVAYIPLDNIRVLVVDDDCVSRNLIRHQLEVLGVVFVDEVESGADCLQLAIDNIYDIIFTDYGLVGLNGIDLLAELRNLDIVAPVVLTTANIEWDGGVERDGVFFSAVLFKPTSLHELQRTLHVFFGGGAIHVQNKNLSVDIMDDVSARALVCASISDDLSYGIRAFESNDFVGLQAFAHKVAGAFMIVGESELSAQARRLEKVLNSKCLDGDIHGTFSVLADSIESWIKGVRVDLH